MNSLNKKKIGQILCEQTDLSQSQLERALEKQKCGETRRLGRILLELGYITQSQLDEALTIQDAFTVGK